MAKQKLILITGSPCVGKSAAADKLLDSLDNSAYLDGDWCWCVHPFSLDDSRLRDGDRAMSFVLSNYLASAFDFVIFSSVVILYESIREPILKAITVKDFEVIAFTLTCAEDTLRARRKKRGDAGDIMFDWLRLPPYPGDIILHTDGKTPAQIAGEMRKIVLSQA